MDHTEAATFIVFEKEAEKLINVPAALLVEIIKKRVR